MPFSQCCKRADSSKTCGSICNILQINKSGIWAGGRKKKTLSWITQVELYRFCLCCYHLLSGWNPLLCNSLWKSWVLLERVSLEGTWGGDIVLVLYTTANVTPWELAAEPWMFKTDGNRALSPTAFSGFQWKGRNFISLWLRALTNSRNISCVNSPLSLSSWFAMRTVVRWHRPLKLLFTRKKKITFFPFCHSYSWHLLQQTHCKRLESTWEVNLRIWMKIIDS